MSHDVIKTIYSDDRKRRVIIFSRADGTFGFREEHFSADSLEQRWIPQSWSRSEPVCSSLEIAMREANGRINWLAGMFEQD